jgi:hypothetical protein
MSSLQALSRAHHPLAKRQEAFIKPPWSCVWLQSGTSLLEQEISLHIAHSLPMYLHR